MTEFNLDYLHQRMSAIEQELKAFSQEMAEFRAGVNSRRGPEGGRGQDGKDGRAGTDGKSFVPTVLSIAEDKFNDLRLVASLKVAANRELQTPESERAATVAVEAAEYALAELDQASK